jgi:hypothetical protein
VDWPVIKVRLDAESADSRQDIFLRTPILNGLKVFAEPHAHIGTLLMDDDVIPSRGQVDRGG